MNGWRWVLWFAAAALAARGGAGEEAATNGMVTVTVDLADGTHLVGTHRAVAVRLCNDYVQTALPLGQVRALTMNSDHETASLEMANGDRLTGVVDLGPLELQTVFGRVSVEIGHVTVLRVRRLVNAVRDAVLYYSFDRDEGRLVRDETGRTGQGQVAGAVWVAAGKAGGAYRFDGRSQFITTPPVDSTGEVTWSVWIRPRSFPVNHDTYAQFLGVRGHAWTWNSDNTSLSFSRQNQHGGSGLALQFFVMGMGNDCGYASYVFPALPEADRWYHVAGVLGADGMRLYLDGKLLAANDNTIKLATPAPFIIGANDNGPQRYFDGLIDEVMVINRALSADEVRALADAPGEAR